MRDYRPINALFKWGDRDRVLPLMDGYPIPLALAFVRSNTQDIELWRRLALVGMELPPAYTYAILTFCIEPKQNSDVNWPNKTTMKETAPFPFRPNDKHWRVIVENSPEVANQIRIQAPDQLPKGITKKMEATEEWL